ncbi:hypothetical protein [Klebsiella aerogenes]|uniref:hypothetical protein n=1 Tax=Klebsiella aerogenes TaxID=548 RepID=UPI00069AA3F9|nr:hypothetical protein [Klebsiella aerogenes]
MTDITRLLASLKRRSAHAKKFGDSITFVKLEDLDALVEALEKAQRYIEELREWNAGLAQESFDRQQRISELLEGKVGHALLERENHHVEVVGKLTEHINQLESRTVKLPTERFCPAEYAGSQLWSETEVWNKAITACADALRAAGIKVEAE